MSLPPDVLDRIAALVATAPELSDEQVQTIRQVLRRPATDSSSSNSATDHAA